MTNFLYALPSILLVGIANILLKWRIDSLSSMQVTVLSKQGFRLLYDPFVLLGAGGTALSVLWWLSIMQRVKVSAVYPIIQAGAIVITLLLSTFFLNERLGAIQLVGIVVLIAGIILTSSGGQV